MILLHLDTSRQTSSVNLFYAASYSNLTRDIYSRLGFVLNLLLHVELPCIGTHFQLERKTLVSWSTSPTMASKVVMTPP
jgi:hypothetical protein